LVGFLVIGEMMMYYPRRAVGIEMNSSIAESLQIIEEFEAWAEDESIENAEALMGRIEEIYDVSVYRFGSLDNDRGGEVQGLTGFTSGCTYLLFEPEMRSTPGWRRIRTRVKKAGGSIEKGSWSQLA